MGKVEHDRAATTYRFTLPCDAQQMARELSEKLKDPAIELPLAAFLARLRPAEGLAALAVAARPEADAPTLTVYAFVDIGAAAAGDAIAKSSLRSVSAAHSTFRRTLRTAHARFATDLWYVPTSRRSVSTDVHAFAGRLVGKTGRTVQSVSLPVNLERVAVTAFAEFARR
jgi:hypothetical protein